MSGKQIIDEFIAQDDIPTAAPSGAVGIDLSVAYQHHTARPDKWLVQATVSVAPSDLFVWGALAFGSPDDASDDVWAVHNDKYGRVLAGKLGTALAVGSHAFIVTDVGVYARLYFQKSAGTVNVKIAPIYHGKRGS